MLSGSLKTSLASESSAVDQRFRAAEQTLAQTGGNLLRHGEDGGRLGSHATDGA